MTLRLEYQTFRASPEDIASFKKLAAIEERSLSDWIRRTLLEKVKSKGREIPTKQIV
jgi:hypothetical protein